MQLSEHFSLAEMVRSETAMRRPELLAKQENPSPYIVENLTYLCNTSLEPLRGMVSYPIKVNSGYRCSEVNRLVGGVPTSQHLFGQAADCNLDDSWLTTAAATEFKKNFPADNIRPNVSANFYLFLMVCKNLDLLDIDQVIAEYGPPGEPEWVHVAASAPGGKGRRQILRIWSDTQGKHSNVLTLGQAIGLGV